MVLFDPVNAMSLARNTYDLVMSDDFSRYTWMEFMATKYEPPQVIIEHIKRIDKEANNANVITLRSDNGNEFKNATLETFWKENGISHISTPSTPQQNGVVKKIMEL